MFVTHRQLIAARLAHFNIPTPATERKRSHIETDEPEAERTIDCNGVDDVVENGRIVKRSRLAATTTHPNKENHAPANYLVGEKHASDSTELRVVLGEIIYADGRVWVGKDPQTDAKYTGAQRRDEQDEGVSMEMDVDDDSYRGGDGSGDVDGDVVMAEADLIEENGEGAADPDGKITRSGRGY